jgi:hypothetical protein
VILIVMPVEAAASELFHQQIQVPNVQTDRVTGEAHLSTFGAASLCSV